MHIRTSFRFLAVHPFGLASRQDKWPGASRLSQTPDRPRCVAKLPFSP
ncbi:MAG: hypothetical protein JRF22_04045 [Deltaproteobacteria bacterium]|nr:hypothetical protein [Deltaproteobacteria bacterium]